MVKLTHHFKVQGQYQGVNRAAMAAVYPARFCKAILDDILMYIQPKGLLRSMHRATRDMVHTFIPGECRYGRIPKEKSTASASSPLADHRRAARHQVPLLQADRRQRERL